MVGLQLTHSGRFARPNVKTRLEPMILYHHPVLDPLFNVDPDLPVLTDDQIDDLIGDFVRAAVQAASIGFDFVDIKHCHGYLGHEFLSAYERPGRYGGSFENRTRFVREIVAGIRREAPDLMIGVRLSAFDFPPFRPGPDGRGVPKWWDDEDGRYPFGFGGDKTDPLAIDNTETAEFLRLLESLDIELVNLSCCSPYYNPHFMRPATFPPSDGYLPPEDPLDRRRPADQRCRRPQNRNSPIWPWSAPATPTCRTGCPMSPSMSSATAWSISWAWDAWCSPIPKCPPMCWLAGHGPQAHLPHLQRLHHRPPQRSGLRLLSAG